MHFLNRRQRKLFNFHLPPERKINMKINIITNGSLKRIPTSVMLISASRILCPEFQPLLATFDLFLRDKKFSIGTFLAR